MIKNKVFFFILAIIILFVGGALRFTNLDKPSMWQDEAEYALFSKTVVENGVPTGTINGVPIFNIEIFENYKLPNDPLYEYRPLKFTEENKLSYYTWLPIYLTALPFKVFCDNLFWARFMAALFGVLTVALIGFIFYKNYGLISGLGIAFLMSIDSGFIQVSRMAQHNSFALFFTLLSQFFYIETINDRDNKKNNVYLISSLIALFYSHQIAFSLFLFYIMFFDLVFVRDFKKIFKKYLILALFILPWVIYIRFWQTLDFVKFNYEKRFFAQAFALKNLYATQLFYLATLLLICLFVIIKTGINFKKIRLEKSTIFIILMPAFYFFVTDFLTPWNFRVEYRVIFLALAILQCANIVWTQIKTIKLQLIILFFLTFFLIFDVPKKSINAELIGFLNGESRKGYQAFWVPEVMRFLNANGYQKEDVLIAEEALVYTFQYEVKAYIPWAISSKKLEEFNQYNVWILEQTEHKESCLETWQYSDDKCKYENYPYINKTKNCQLSEIVSQGEKIKIWKCPASQAKT